MELISLLKHVRCLSSLVEGLADVPPQVRNKSEKQNFTSDTMLLYADAGVAVDFIIFDMCCILANSDNERNDQKQVTWLSVLLFIALLLFFLFLLTANFPQLQKTYDMWASSSFAS